MFDNIATVLIQALGFFLIFVFFTYQTLFADKNPYRSQKDYRKPKNLDTKNSTKKNQKTGIFNRNPKPIEEDLLIKKNGLFGRKTENIREEIKTKKKGWFK